MRGLVVAAALASAARLVAADPVPDAERYYNEGQTAYDAKRYDDAITAWNKSYALSHLPGLVYNLAQAHRLHGDCTEALDAYKKFLELDPKSPQRASAEGFIHDLEPCPTTAVTIPTPPPVTPPPPPPPVQPPPQHVVTHGNGNGGERTIGLVLVGAGVVAAATGGYFGAQAQSLASDVKTACASGCDYDTIKSKDQQGRSDQQLQYIMYGVGGAAVATGVVLYMLGRTHTEVAVAPVRGGAALTWSHPW